LNLRRHPLAVILEISLSALREFEVLVPLPLGVSQQGIEIALNLIGARAFSIGSRALGVFRLTRGWRR
jgi:hypothetical protein